MSPSRLHDDVARVRDWSGRAGTVAGAAALTAALFTPQALPTTAPWIIGATAAGIATTIRPWRSHIPGLLPTLYAIPSTVLLGEMIAFQAVDGVHLAEVTAAAAWTTGVWWLRPARLATDLAQKATPPPATEVVIPDATAIDLTKAGTPEDRLAAFWQQHLAHDNGAAPGTHLENITVHGPRDFRVEIVAPTGQPVPTISTARLSALMDIPEDLIHIGPVPGRGTGRRELAVTPTPDGDTPQALDLLTAWDTHIAPKAMPGARIIAVRRGSTQKGELA